MKFINRHEMADSKGYLQDQDRELRGIIRAVCARGSGASPLPSKQGPHGINKTSGPSVHHWAGGYGQNWNVRFALSITKHFYLVSRCQNSGCAGGYGQIHSHEQLQEQMTFPKEANGKFSRFRV
jgi:hypothetical protein